MIHIRNLRIEEHGKWSRMVADISSDVNREDKETTIWVGVEQQNAIMLNDSSYNMFLFLPVYMAMYYNEDIHIHGSVSKTLYRNVNDYIMNILSSFSTKLHKVRIIVDGFNEIAGQPKLIGTGLSCGVDNLATIYKYHELEEDPDYKLNSLFMLNCGWHGSYYSEKTMEVFEQRYRNNKKAAEEMKLGFYMVDSNLHAFLPKLDDQISFFHLYSCIFALEKELKRYYLSSSFSYDEVLKFGYSARERDFSEYADPMAIPLMRTESFSIVSDGCQYSRSNKTELISDWTISKKYLNVCCKNDDENNCSVCHKCMRTLIPLDALGKLDEYSAVFDVEKYRTKRNRELNMMVVKRNKDGFYHDNYEFCTRKGMKMPSYLHAFAATFLERFQGLVNRKIRKK